MGAFIKGDVIVAALTFSDLSGGKRRPAVVVATPDGVEDVILCMITSQSRDDGYDVVVHQTDFQVGGVRMDCCNARPCHLFTLSTSLILYKAGVLKPEKVNQIITKIIKLMA